MTAPSRSSAIANATGTSFASANANLDGIYQHADASNGTAVASIDNNGSIAVLASANASVAGATTGTGLALANATVSYGISQSAEGVAASALLNNGANGSIDIGAVAVATGTAAGEVTFTGGWSTAYNHGAIANVNDGIVQNAHATGTYTTERRRRSAGDAVAQITNAGTIDIHATATANGTVDGGGDAYAAAYVGTGIGQNADGRIRAATPRPR